MSTTAPLSRSTTIMGLPFRWLVVGLGGVFLVICGAVALLLMDARDSARSAASLQISNLSATLTQDIARNIELYDLSLQAVLEGIADPTVMASSKALRQMILFDRAATARYLGAIVVLDDHGNVVIDSASTIPRPFNYADRDYFLAHKQRNDLGLYIGKPVHSKTDNQLVISLSRRYNKPDGSFGGVVIGTLRLDYLHNLFSRVHLGSSGSVTLFRSDGTLIMREPYDPSQIGRSYNPAMLFHEIAKAPEGELEGKSTVDGVQRLYHYHTIADLPLIQLVASSTDDIYEDWWRKTAWTTLVLAICGGIILALCVALRIELQRREEAEASLVVLSEEDKLTGLANRRKFDQTLASEWKRGVRLGGWLSLLMIDVDHFKAYNDSFGHPAGDAALSALAHCFARWAQRAGDVTARYGGEEFGIILPHMTPAEAMRLAEVIRQDVLTLKLDHPTSPWRKLSVSIGIASVRPAPEGKPEDLIEDADQALYASKKAGRNRSTAFAPVMMEETAQGHPDDVPRRAAHG